MTQRILVIEDQPDKSPDSAGFVDERRAYADFEVIEAEDGESGLAAAARKSQTSF
jgi:hypothetical protein